MQKSITSQEYIKTNQILTLALTTGLSLFIAVAFYLQYSGSMTLYIRYAAITSFKTLMPLASLMAIAVSFLFWIASQKVTNSLPSLSEKLIRYRTTSLIRFAYMEAGAIFSVLGYWFTNQIFMLGIAIGTACFMAINIQHKRKIIQDLQLTGEDMLKMQNPDTIVMTQEVSEDA